MYRSYPCLLSVSIDYAVLCGISDTMLLLLNLYDLCNVVFVFYCLSVVVLRFRAFPLVCSSLLPLKF